MGSPAKELEQASTVFTDLALMSEPMAMQEIYRFQVMSIQRPQPPSELPTTLPREWPLARMSVSIRHVSILLRVTLLRRIAELSFRGHAFVDLPREEKL